MGVAVRVDRSGGWVVGAKDLETNGAVDAVAAYEGVEGGGCEVGEGEGYGVVVVGVCGDGGEFLAPFERS